MPESRAHAILVNTIIAYLQKTISPLNEMMILHDSIDPVRGERPTKINGFIPDIFASDVPTTWSMTGEAKTEGDIETKHSRQQIAAFLDYLAYTQNGLLVLAVPISLKPRAKSLVQELGFPLGTKMPKFDIIGESSPHIE